MRREIQQHIRNVVENIGVNWFTIGIHQVWSDEFDQIRVGWPLEGGSGRRRGRIIRC